ncbi:MAG: hypothetical protein AB1530_04605 [Candidatus Omnitrophota bacterium]
MPLHTFQNTVEPVYGIDKFGLIKLCYFDNKMSDIEIIETIERDTGYRFSRMAVKKWRDEFQLKARNPHERFQLAVNKKRFDHEKVAQKIDYNARTRKIDYENRFIDYDKIKKTVTSKYGYKWATGLDALLNRHKISDEKLAKYLKIGHHAIYQWKTLRSRVNKAFQDKISEYFGTISKKIFSSNRRKKRADQ